MNGASCKANSAIRRPRPRSLTSAGKFAHGFLRDHTAFTTGKRSAESSRVARNATRRRFGGLPHNASASCTASSSLCKPPAFHGAAGECFLIGRKLHFHGGSSLENTPVTLARRAWRCQ